MYDKSLRSMDMRNLMQSPCGFSFVKLRKKYEMPKFEFGVWVTTCKTTNEEV